MTVQDRIEEIIEAQETLQAGLEQLRQALSGTPNELHYRSYILAHLDNWINGGNPYDSTIPVIIEELEEEYQPRHITYYNSNGDEVAEESFEGSEDEAWHHAELTANQQGYHDYEVSGR